MLYQSPRLTGYLALLEGEEKDTMWHKRLSIVEKKNEGFCFQKEFTLPEKFERPWMFGSVLELKTGEIATAATRTKNIYFVNENFCSLRSLPFENQSEPATFWSMSLVNVQSQELIACSFSKPDSITMYSANQSALELILSIPLNFSPLRSIWVPNNEKLIVFDMIASYDFVSIDLKTRSNRQTHMLHCSEKRQIQACCLLEGDEINKLAKIAIYEGETSSLQILEISYAEMLQVAYSLHSKSKILMCISYQARLLQFSDLFKILLTPRGLPSILSLNDKKPSQLPRIT